MPIPTSLNDMSTTDASNSPAGGDQVFPDADNYFRGIQGALRRGFGQASAVASAATITVPADYSSFHITGTTTVTAFASTNAWTGRKIDVTFDAATPLTHNGTSFILPGAANITAAAGDTARFEHEGSGNWRCLAYQKAGGYPAFSAYRGSSQSINTSTYTKVQFATEDFDTHSAFDAVTNYRFQPTVAGYYQINLQVTANSMTASNYWIAAIYKNGSLYRQNVATCPSNTTSAASMVSAVVFLNGSSDYIEGYTFHADGVNRNVDGNSYSTFINGVRIA
jgi:hypothetical protein